MDYRSHVTKDGGVQQSYGQRFKFVFNNSRNLKIANFRKETYFFNIEMKKNEKRKSIVPAMIIMQMVKIFSLSVSAATLPNPTEVMQVIVKYNAVTYMVLLDGPATNSGAVLVLVHR